MFELSILSSRPSLCDCLDEFCHSLLPAPFSIERFSSGQAAAGYLERNDPLIAFICDDLPDVDGVHLISELHMHDHNCRFVLVLDRDSDYVPQLQRGMGAGISDVLFYPFSREEVHCQLLRALEQAVSADDAQTQLARSIRSLRNTFMDRFLAADVLPYTTIAALNAQYHVNLSNGMFQIALIRFPSLTERDGMEHCQMMLDSIVAEVRQLLDPICFEMIPFIRDLNTVVFVLNYSSAQNAEPRLRTLPELIQRSIDRFFRFPLPYVAGVGHPEGDCLYLKRAFQSAQYAARCQLLFGSNRLFLYDDYTFDSPSLHTPEQEGFLASLAAHAETLDAQGAAYAVYQLTSVLTQNTDPALISALCEQIQLTALTALRKVVDLPEDSPTPAEVEYHLDTELSLSGLKASLADWLQRLIDRCRDAKSRSMLRPIHEAKQYVDQNYARRLTLQNVAEKIGLSPSYFCTLFRKEVGVSFSAYLNAVRMEHAKALLLDSPLDIASISERVGYQDARYFSRVFSKAVGVQPTTYRKLHRRGGES